jgi:hypothetical protein
VRKHPELARAQTFIKVIRLTVARLRLSHYEVLR